jgi:hypothetical protein
VRAAEGFDRQRVDVEALAPRGGVDAQALAVGGGDLLALQLSRSDEYPPSNHEATSPQNQITLLTEENSQALSQARSA